MIIEQGLNNKDFQVINSKLQRANIEQLEFIKAELETEIKKRLKINKKV